MSDQSTLAKPTPPKTKPTVDHEETNFLNATHRCDGPGCSAAAYVKLILKESERLPEGGELLFCSHHYNKYEEGVKPIVLEKFDERHKLQQNKLVGTENS